MSSSTKPSRTMTDTQKTNTSRYKKGRFAHVSSQVIRIASFPNDSLEKSCIDQATLTPTGTWHGLGCIQSIARSRQPGKPRRSKLAGMCLGDIFWSAMWGFLKRNGLSITYSWQIGFWEHDIADIEASKMQGREEGYQQVSVYWHWVNVFKIDCKFWSCQSHKSHPSLFPEFLTHSQGEAQGQKVQEKSEERETEDAWFFSGLEGRISV